MTLLSVVAVSYVGLAMFNTMPQQSLVISEKNMTLISVPLILFLFMNYVGSFLAAKLNPYYRGPGCPRVKFVSSFLSIFQLVGFACVGLFWGGQFKHETTFLSTQMLFFVVFDQIFKVNRVLGGIWNDIADKFA